ncbi:sugar phosphate isomerase/epimerase [Candidatus Woesearchaeota archaeon]|nr:sugar phosphate isomerase/epimerase [Candidatus Woesearchaeota archaeon]
MIWAAQNKYWGRIEESTEYWSSLGIKHIMVKNDPNGNFKLINSDACIPLKNYKLLSKLQEQHNIKYHFHPYNLIVDNKIITHPDEENLPKFRAFLKELDKIISDYNFYPLITLHLPFTQNSKRNILISEQEAIKMSEAMLNGLGLKASIALENMYTPGHNSRDPDISLLGYDPSHFKKAIGNEKNIGLCIDIGHTNLCNRPIKDFLNTDYPVYSIHLHGNDLSGDWHLKPDDKSVKDVAGTISAIRKCQGPVVLEIVDKTLSKKSIIECMQYWTQLVE